MVKMVSVEMVKVEIISMVKLQMFKMVNMKMVKMIWSGGHVQDGQDGQDGQGGGQCGQRGQGHANPGGQAGHAGGAGGAGGFSIFGGGGLRNVLAMPHHHSKSADQLGSLGRQGSRALQSCQLSHTGEAMQRASRR